MHIELKHIVPRRKSSNKLRPMIVVCKSKKKLKNIHRLKGTTYYVNKGFSKETPPYRKKLGEKVKVLRKEGKVIYLNYYSIVFKERDDPQV